jgi:hypothetical protein
MCGLLQLHNAVRAENKMNQRCDGGESYSHSPTHACVWLQRATILFFSVEKSQSGQKRENVGNVCKSEAVAIYLFI